MNDVRRSTAVTRSLIGLAVVAVVAGVAFVVVALTGQESAPASVDVGSISAPASTPTPSPSTSSSSAGGDSSTAPSTTPSTASAAGSDGRPLERSLPTRVRIPSIGVDTVVNPIGLAADGSLAVPQPGPRLDQAAWFENSPTPGQLGPSIIEGHVDSTEGPSVFFRLAALRPGDRILVTRADGRELTFTVDGLRDYDKAAFPTRVVYGGDLSRPQLRIITCSDFDTSIRHHTGNTVVFSHLTKVTGGTTSKGTS